MYRFMRETRPLFRLDGFVDGWSLAPLTSNGRSPSRSITPKRAPSADAFWRTHAIFFYISSRLHRKAQIVSSRSPARRIGSLRNLPPEGKLIYDGFKTSHKGEHVKRPLRFEGTDRYHLNPELREIVNIAIALEKPLLLTGEAGTGKTQLAFEIARALDLQMEEARCKSTFKGEELCYVYDTVLRLNDSRFGSGDTGRDVNNIWDYIRFGPIGRAFTADDRRVLLLDEIDKTDSDTQDNLLDVLEDGSFIIREINHRVAARQRPIIIITSNAKRELSDPFLRRCFCHYIPFPTPEEMTEIVRLHHPDIPEPFLEAALTAFYRLREQGFEKPPATAELLDWIGALKESGARGPGAGKDMVHLGTLLKRTQDILKFKGVPRPFRF